MEEFAIKNNVLTKYTGTAEEVVIPNGVEEIGGWAFFYCRFLKEVAIPASVKKIGDAAFAGCELLERICLPEGLEAINEHAFSSCNSLKTITIPASVKEIGDGAFKYCEALEQVVLSEGLKEISKEVFYECKSLMTITIPASVKEIGDDAFHGCKSLEQVDLAEGLEKIGEWAFWGCELKSITIPASVEQIGHDAFRLKNITFIGAAPKMGKDAFGKVEVIYAPKASAVDFSQYKEAYLIGFLQMLKDGVAIDENIIENNKKNIKLNAKKLCETKYEELFVYMLQNALIPLNVVDELITKYNEEKNVARLTALIDYKNKNFTEKQKEEQFNKQFEVREPSFAELRKIWTFSKRESGTYRISAYKGEDAEDIVIPSMINGVKVTEVGSGNFDYSINLFFGRLSDKIKSITLPEGVETIIGHAFSRCKALRTITIPASVKEIWDGAFEDCESLEQVILPGTLKELCFRTFTGCKSLKSIVIPASVKKIGLYVFEYCKSLEQVILPETLKEIGSRAFNGCASLKSIVIPASVKKIGREAFYDCPHIIVYCRSEKKPEKWHEEWDQLDYDGHKVKVVWGYKGE